MGKLVCRNCQQEFPLTQLYNCPSCAGILEVIDPMLKNAKDILLKGSKHHQDSMWRYFDLLPICNPENIVSLGEGQTPILKDYRITKDWGIDVDLNIKLESMNPTGSFKDRPTSVGISFAKEMGQDTVVVASSGNAGASVAAYAARSGMRCLVFVPQSTDPGKMAQIQAYGANVLAVEGGFSENFNFVKKVSERYNWTNLVSTFLNPYTVEADKTVAYELFHQLNGEVPDVICVPIGTGPLLVGVWKGYQELLSLGLTDKMPKMVGVQAKGCEPITRAFELSQAVKGWREPINTIAGGISDALIGYEKDGDLTISVVLESKGTILSLDEAEVEESTRLLETKMGVYSEPTGAVSVGAVKKLYDRGFLKEGQSVVSLMTGHGFKYTQRATEKICVVNTVEEVGKIFK